MDLEQMIIGDLAREKTAKWDRIIEEAFAEHFGFPIRDVQDIENLRRISSPGTTIESLMYQGQTFLYLDTHQDLDVRLIPGGGYEVKMQLKYQKV